MGIGIVLLFWFVVGALGAAAAGTVSGLAAHFIAKRQKRPSWRWTAMFSVFPFLCLTYLFFAAFPVYWLWCERFRGVDAGLGDYWRVPLGNGYAFSAGDTFEWSSIEAPSGRQSHSGLSQIGQQGDVVFGREPAGFFVVKTRTGSDELVTPSEWTTPPPGCTSRHRCCRRRKPSILAIAGLRKTSRQLHSSASFRL